MNNILISNLFDISRKYLVKLTEDIILDYKHTIKLNAYDNHNVTNVESHD